MYAQREHTLLQILAHRYNIPVHTLEELLPTEQMEQEQYHKQKHKHNEYQKRIRQQKGKDEEEEEEEEEFKKGLGLGLEKDVRTQLNDMRKQKGLTPMDLRSQLQELEQRQQEMSTSFNKKKNQKKKNVNAHNNQLMSTDDPFMSTDQSASDKTKSSGSNVSSGTPLNNAPNNAHKRVRRKTFAMVTSKLQSPTNSTNTSEKNIKRKKSAEVHKKQAEDLSRLLQTDIARSSLSEMSIQEEEEEEEEEEESESDKDEDEEEKKNHAYTVSGELRELENEFTLKEEEHGSGGASSGLGLRRSSFLQKVSNLKKNDKETF